MVSFYIDGLHFNLGVRMLNDRFGIQVRGGCSCAGTYGHYLLHVTEETSRSITDLIDHGDLSLKPGWIRLSLHPTSPDSEVRYIAESITELAAHHREWAKDYDFDAHTGHLCFANAEEETDLDGMVHGWFDPAAFTAERMLS